MKPVKVAILGTRGIPANYGGFETFAEEVSLRLVEKGYEVMVVGDRGLEFDQEEYKRVRIYKTKSSKPGNPLKFYQECFAIAKKEKADFQLVCGAGAFMLIPFYKNKNIAIAINPDGLGYLRKKHPWWKRKLFYTQYLLSAFTSAHLVFDSVGIQKYYANKLKRRKNASVIEYGTYINLYLNEVVTPEMLTEHGFNVEPNKFHLVVARLEPENNVLQIIQGYNAEKRKFPLIIVGNTNTKHANQLLTYEGNGVHFVGGIYDKNKLQLLRYTSRSYFHGHSVGGTNPSLLEAMGSRNLCVCHDNDFNREVVENNGLYFKNHLDAANRFTEIETGSEIHQNMKTEVLAKARDYYSWDKITNKYIELIHKLLP